MSRADFGVEGSAQDKARRELTWTPDEVAVTSPH
jgi:hypothetical protein